MNTYISAYQPVWKSFVFIGFFLSLFVSCNQSDEKVFDAETLQNNNIKRWIHESGNKSRGLNQRKYLLLKAYRSNQSTKNDSLKNRSLARIAYGAYKIDDSTFFKKINQEALSFSTALKDTIMIGVLHAYYGLYYIKQEKWEKSYFHFQKGYKNFQMKSHDYNSGRVLYYMAYIQKNIKNYTGSEILCIQAIEKFKKLNKSSKLYLCYNLLGDNFHYMKEYDKALVYYQRALDKLDQIENKRTYEEMSHNNLGLIYQKRGEYRKSIAHYKKALLTENIKKIDIKLYAELIDNYAFVRFLNGDYHQVEEDFYSALNIRDSIKHYSGSILSKLHLAEYYAWERDTTLAIDFAQEASQLASKVDNNRDKLASLQLLSELDPDNDESYLKDYIALSDRLQAIERKLRNKFALIRFETEEYMQETEKLSEEKKYLIIGSSIVVLILSLLYLLKIQRARNKELILEKEQQKANEEILRLMLDQQSKREEGKLKERQRISADLHDGVLSKIFGARMGLGLLKIKANKETMCQQKQFINELMEIEKEIRNISHELINETISCNLDFVTLVEELIDKQSKVANYQYNFECDKCINWQGINDQIKINCYRIIQEGLQNIYKHAKATKVNIAFFSRDNHLIMNIEDNGQGFDCSKKCVGIGIKNIQLRIQQLNGSRTITSKIDQGTTITIKIPYSA